MDMMALTEICELRCREWPAAGGRILLLLDECDHLIQQQHFQDALAEVLRHCASYRVVLSTQQPMVGTAGGCFKVVHHELGGMSPKDAARLFLRRAQRPIRWDEIVVDGGSDGGGGGDAAAPAAATAGGETVKLTKENEANVLELIATHPSIAAQRGNPRRLIELASRVVPSLTSLADLIPLPGGV